MKTLMLLGAACAAGLAIVPANAQPVTPSQAPKVQVRTRVEHMRMPQTRDQVVAHVRAMFARFDANHDGFLTRQELAAATQRMQARIRQRMDGEMPEQRNWAVTPNRPIPDRGAAFDRIDTNHDGVITRDEFINAQPMMAKREFRIVERRRAGADGHATMTHADGGMMMERMFAMADTNHDGRLSMDEATAALLHHFDIADTNHDGVLSPDERRQAHRMMMDHPAN